MASPKRIETQPNPVGHAEIGNSLGTPELHYDLLAEIEGLHKEDAWLHGTGPSSKSLVKHPDLRIVLIAMKKKMFMLEHKTTARISIQTLAGHIRIKLPDRTVELPAGQLLVLDQCISHDVEAKEDSAFLLTLSWRSQGSAAGETDDRTYPAKA